MNLQPEQYTGIEWSVSLVDTARAKGLNVIRGDLNKAPPFEGSAFDSIFGLSVLEHLLYPCSYIKECHRVLKDDGSLIILTPNISTFFTAALILFGKIPSSGPHPDSE
ncbi:MAG: SAM-dependent methyltransferase [Gammaproteobacteria bacterium]|jgi:SAM-dependent methyltransferase